MEQYNNMTSENINISDILEVIQTTDPGSMATITMDNEQPYVKIIEQPASKALRFRYECEGRSAGSIPGANSTPENKTFPSIRIIGYKGRAMVVVSCVTKDAPYRPHPHNLVGKEVCKQGVCTVEVPAGNMIVTFSNLGIQCVKKKDIEEALKVREELRVDPFRTGFEHKKQPTNIDLNAVRLCFQVFLEGSRKGKFTRPLAPIVSDPIYDKKAMSDLVICKLSHCSASVAGGMEMILLCEKVAKEDIQVRFFEEDDGQLTWEGFGDFQPTHVHKQTAIAFRTPTYRMQQVEQPVQVHIQLKRPSDGATSEPLPFQMLPLDDMDSLRRKRQKFSNNPSALVFKHVAETEKRAKNQTFNFNIVKAEPTDQMPPFGAPSTSTACGFTLQSVTKKESNTLQAPRIKVSPGRTPSPMEYNNTPYSPQQHSPQYQSNIPPIVQNELADRISPFGSAAAIGSYTLPLSVINHQQKIMPSHLRTQVSPGRTPSPMEYNTAYSPPSVQQQQQQQSPQQYQPSISPIMQMPSSSINANLYSYTPEQARLQQVEPNLYTLGKVQDSMSHAKENQGPELQLVELDNASIAATPDVTKLLDMDTQQLNFDYSLMDSNDFTDFGSLSANLSSGLSLTDGMQPSTSNAEETNQTNSMTEETNRIIWIKQELSTLNNIFKPNRRNDDEGLA
ncbi:proto-oncogene c-Rel-like isoform X3 [Odontomachus brunneus]|uniref:proto-oncogene c-Rel-like isoform X3 n=1 Tax=Odontomachus brunneus TaxID=486640 RepID=UPI0013F19E8F|nr:proto-oncogene c-Rel-like isoform X3 [Odontomachus brunneus]